MSIRVGTPGLIVALLAAAPAAAQDTLVLQLLDSGKPVAETPVRDGGGRTVGTTGADGRVAFDMSLLDFGKGDRVEVWVKECRDGRVEVVLVEAGSGDPCAEEDAAAGEGCDCRRIGAFVWGPGRVVVDVGAGNVAHVPPRGGGGGGNAPPQLIGIGGGLAFFPNLEKNLEDVPGLAGSDSDPVAPLVQAVYEARLSSRLPIVLGAEVQYALLGEQTQTFAGGPGEPIRSMVDQTVLSTGLYGAFRPSPHFGNRTAFWQALGFWWVYNSAEIETFYEGIDEPVLEDRSESGLRLGARVGVDHYFTPRAGLRFDAGYTVGEGDDADTNWSLAAKWIWLPKPWRERRWEVE